MWNPGVCWPGRVYEFGPARCVVQPCWLRKSSRVDSSHYVSGAERAGV